MHETPLREILRFALPLAAVLWFLLGVVLRGVIVYRRTGRSPVVLPRDDSAQGFIGRVMRAIFALIALDVAAFAAGGDVYAGLAPIRWLERDEVAVAGLVLFALSTVVQLVAQAQMGDSFRIGIDTERHTTLVERGLYRRSRNPIYVGMLGALAALMLLAPNALTLLLAGLGFTLVQVQVRLEEEHLARAHGDAFEAYRRRVRRWL